MEPTNPSAYIANISLTKRIAIAAAALAACYFGLPHVEQWLNMQPGWGTGVCLALGMILFPNQRWFRTTKFADFMVFVIIFAVAMAAIQTWFIPWLMPTYFFLPLSPMAARNQQLVLTLICVMIIPVANATLEWIMSWFN